jgi:hypothetical protein
MPPNTTYSMNDLRGLPQGGLIANHAMSARRGTSASQMLIVPSRVRGSSFIGLIIEEARE